MRVQAKDKFATALKACNFIKKRLLAGCFPVSIPNVLGTIFLQNNYGEFLKNKVSGEIAFDLISLFHVQLRDPTSSSTTTRASVFPAKFYYHKLFGDIKIYQCHVIKK